MAEIDLMIGDNKKAEEVFAEMVRLNIQGVWVGAEWTGYYDRKTGDSVKTTLPPLIGDMMFWVGHHDQKFQEANPGHDGYLHVLNDL